MTSHISPNKLIACQQCDSMFDKPTIDEGQKAVCRCCGATLFTRKIDPFIRTIAVAIAGLLIFFPAMNLPIMGISAAGVSNNASLLDCITLMINSQFYVIAFCVFMFTVAIPIVRLVTALYLSICVQFNWVKPSLFVFYRSYHLLDSWTMIHVFFLGIIVSMYKLVSLAELSVGGGLFCLVFLLICSTLVSVTMDQHQMWEELEKAVEK